MKRDRTRRFVCTSDEGHYMRVPLREEGTGKTSGKKGGVRVVKTVRHLCRLCGERAIPVAYYVGG